MSSQHLGGLWPRVDQNGVLDINDKWPVKDIVYTSIVGAVMLAALLEWFLWVAAFLYCLVKCFQKAEFISIKILSVVMMILFTALRYVFLSHGCQNATDSPSVPFSCPS